MEKQTSKNSLYGTTVIKCLALGCCLLILNGCVPSENPVSEELVKTGMPTFSGSSGNRASFYTTATSSFVLQGDCDPISKGIEWSYDNIHWTTLQGGCANGSFTIQVFVPKTRDVYARALTKMGHTDAAVAKIRFVLPPTAPTFQFVSAGSAVEDGEQAVQFTMSGTSDGRPMESSTHSMVSHSTGIVYAPE